MTSKIPSSKSAPRCLVLVILAGLLFCLAGCPGGGPDKPACIPKEAEEALGPFPEPKVPATEVLQRAGETEGESAAATEPKPAEMRPVKMDKPSQPSGPSKVVYYMDGSGSMKGYFKKRVEGDNSRYAFETIVRLLPAAGDMVSPRRSFYLFGSRQPWRCTPQEFIRKNYKDNQTSRIDMVLDRTRRAGPNTLSVIVTDLFLSTVDVGLVRDGEPGLVTRPLAGILEDGLAVGVLAVESGFEGKLYDFMGAPGSGVEYKGRHPFYILLVGRPDKIVEFRDRLERLIGANVPPRHFVLFSRQQSPGKPDKVLKLIQEQGVSPWSGMFAPFTRGLPRLQYKLDPGSDLKLELNLDAFRRPHALPLATPGVEAVLWIWSPMGLECNTGWTRQPDEVMRTDVHPLGAGRFEVTLSPKNEQGMTTLASGYTYYCLLTIKPGTAIGHSGKSAWIEKWSFQGFQGEELVANKERVDLFPTYNLRLFMEALAAMTEPRTAADVALHTVGLALEH